MTNQLQMKKETLEQILANNRLLKTAEQTITHKKVTSQKDLGQEQTMDINENVDGTLASEPEAANKATGKAQELPGVQPLNASAESALASTGTGVDNMNESGKPAGTPADTIKTASAYRKALAGIISELDKTAAAKAPENFRTGTEVLQKFASLSSDSTEQDLKSAEEDLMKLASSNPVFSLCRDRIIMEKMAADINELAAAEGIPVEQAAAELDAAAAQNPEMAQELEDEATGEAVAELADAEAATDEFMTGLQAMADDVSGKVGIEVTPDMLAEAAEQTVEVANQLGVEPEVLIQAALEEMAGGTEGAKVSPEDEANAQKILDAAAENGISPEEVIQLAAEELDKAQQEAGEPAEAPVEKAASLQKRAGTNRAAFVQALRRGLI